VKKGGRLVLNLELDMEAEYFGFRRCL